jgi:hypothetical protein
MNEQELRDGLRKVIVASSPPPSMNPNAALDSARRAHKRRRATYAGAGAGLAVVAMAAGAVFALAPSGGQPLPIDPAVQQAPPRPVMTGNETPPGSGGKTETSWPDGQTDRTARSGPQAAKGNALLDAVKGSVPDTLTVNLKTEYSSGHPVTSSQSQFEDYVGGDQSKQIWEHLATVAVNRKTAPNGGTGRIFVQVVTPGRTTPTDVCEVAKDFWGMGGTCAPQQIQGKTVGVITKSNDPRIDQAAAYRYDDGTTVVVAQSMQPTNSRGGNEPVPGSMTAPPLTIEQLAPLALNPAFKVS